MSHPGSVHLRSTLGRPFIHPSLDRSIQLRAFRRTLITPAVVYGTGIRLDHLPITHSAPRTPAFGSYIRGSAEIVVEWVNHCRRIRLTWLGGVGRRGLSRRRGRLHTVECESSRGDWGCSQLVPAALEQALAFSLARGVPWPRWGSDLQRHQRQPRRSGCTDLLGYVAPCTGCGPCIPGFQHRALKGRRPICSSHCRLPPAIAVRGAGLWIEGAATWNLK